MRHGRAAHHSSGESESLYGSKRRFSFGSHDCVDVSSQRSRDSCELRMTGCRSCSHAKLLLAAVVTIVNVQSGSDWPVIKTATSHRQNPFRSGNTQESPPPPQARAAAAAAAGSNPRALLW